MGRCLLFHDLSVFDTDKQGYFVLFDVFGNKMRIIVVCMYLKWLHCSVNGNWFTNHDLPSSKRHNFFSNCLKKKFASFMHEKHKLQHVFCMDCNFLQLTATYCQIRKRSLLVEAELYQVKQDLPCP